MNETKDAIARGVGAGALVVVNLREPREKCWGVLDAVTNAGVYLRAIDLQAFEDFVRAAQQGEPLFGIADLFFPLWRIERIARDASSGTIPSLAEQFAERAGQSAAKLFSNDLHASAAASDVDSAQLS